jgi:biotin-(acetyl-CoA carboxylase) ligase
MSHQLVNLPIVWRTTKDKATVKSLTIRMATVFATKITAIADSLLMTEYRDLKKHNDVYAGGRNPAPLLHRHSPMRSDEVPSESC